ncbi:MAG: hypothetical protein OXF66_01270 [Gammaproteobacteria bacterium]|nr:hypothetical protein [Gammaproteobacteria bacterium]MCY4165035.1 hypothetical protein [Gammaproteobacteria bacterium]MCY4254879.1 hypothetical protein [Gammaproteobacteria bacterium]MCY4341008.1 hypothetical protein [Gammaproteobacteria bacterium]
MARPHIEFIQSQAMLMKPGGHLFSWDAKLNPVLPPELAEYAPKVEPEAAYY